MLTKLKYFNSTYISLSHIPDISSSFDKAINTFRSYIDYKKFFQENSNLMLMTEEIFQKYLDHLQVDRLLSQLQIKELLGKSLSHKKN